MSEMHYLKCQDENCEKAACVDRRMKDTEIRALQAQVAEMRKALGNLAFKGHCFCTTDKIPDDLHAAYCVNARAALALTPTDALEKWKAMERVVALVRQRCFEQAFDALDGKPPSKD